MRVNASFSFGWSIGLIGWMNERVGEMGKGGSVGMSMDIEFLVGFEVLFYIYVFFTITRCLCL